MPRTPRYAVYRGRQHGYGADIANQINQGAVTAASDCHVDVTPFNFGTSTQANTKNGQGVVAWEVEVRNETGADRRVWLGGRFSDTDDAADPSDIWSAGQFVAATTTYTDDTTDAKDAGADDFALQTTTNDDGFLVGGGQQSRVHNPQARQFNCLVVSVSTAYNNGGLALGSTSSEHNWQYWNGSSWSNLTLISDPVDLGLAAEEYCIVWHIPSDWAVYADGDVNGTDDRLIGQYVIRYVNVDAPSAAAADADRLYVGWARKAFLLVPNGGAVSAGAEPMALASADERVWMVMDGGASADMECWISAEDNESVGMIGGSGSR